MSDRAIDLTADSSDEEARQAKRQRTHGSPDDVVLVEQAAQREEPLQEEQLDDDIAVLGSVGEVRAGDRGAGAGSLLALQAPPQP